jgi:hypothetical protein
VDGADTATVVQEVLAPASAYGIAGFELARRSTAEPAQDDTVLAALTHNRRLTLDPELRIWLADTLWLHLASTPEPGLVFTAGDSGRGAEGRLLAVDTSVVAGGTTYGGVLAWSLHRWGALPDSTIGSWYDIRYYAPEVGLVLRDRIRVTGTGRDSSRTELLEFRPGGAGVGPGGQAPRTGPRLHGRASLAPR